MRLSINRVDFCSLPHRDGSNISPIFNLYCQSVLDISFVKLMGRYEKKKADVNQHGGGVFWAAFKSLMWVLLIALMITFLVSFLAIKFFQHAPIVGPLIRFGCGISNSGMVEVVLILADLLILIPPLFPVAAITMTFSKIYRAFTIVCMITGATPWTMMELLWGAISLIPVGGSLGKIARFFM